MIGLSCSSTVAADSSYMWAVSKVGQHCTAARAHSVENLRRPACATDPVQTTTRIVGIDVAESDEVWVRRFST